MVWSCQTVRIMVVKDGHKKLVPQRDMPCPQGFPVRLAQKDMFDPRALFDAFSVGGAGTVARGRDFVV